MQKLAPHVELVCKVIRDWVGHSVVLEMLLVTSLAKICLLLQAVETGDFVWMIVTLGVVDASLFATNHQPGSDGLSFLFLSQFIVFSGRRYGLITLLHLLFLLTATPLFVNLLREVCDQHLWICTVFNQDNLVDWSFFIRLVLRPLHWLAEVAFDELWLYNF